MQVKVYIASDPRQFDLNDVRRGCPKLSSALSEHSVSMTEVRWDGKISSLPQTEQVIVLVTTRIVKKFGSAYGELTSYCFKQQHLLVIFDEGVVGPSGELFTVDEDPEEYEMTIQQFLDCLPKH